MQREWGRGGGEEGRRVKNWDPRKGGRERGAEVRKWGSEGRVRVFVTKMRTDVVESILLLASVGRVWCREKQKRESIVEDKRRKEIKTTWI